MDMNQYLDIFIDEAKEHLIKLNEWLLKLENEPNNIDYINEIFRSAHTLKGSAATMGFENMATLTHEMENLLDLIRNNKISVNVEIIDIIFNCLDLLDKMVNSIITNGNDDINSINVINMLEKVSNISTSNTFSLKESFDNEKFDYDQYESTIIKQSLQSGYFINKIVVSIDEEAVLKSVRVFMVLNEMEKYGEVLKTNPPIEILENEEFGSGFALILITKEKEENIINVIRNISEIKSVNITPITTDDLKIKGNKNNIDSTNLKNDDTISSMKFLNKMVRVDIDRLDELMNLFSELIIDRGRLEKLASDIKNNELSEIVQHVNRITTDLQTNILNLRMVQVEQVFNRFPRMIRDLSKELNKKVNLNIIGAETELDRTVVDEIGDPLVHILRNAVDHGLESTQTRLKSNKSENGNITLKAYQSGNNIFIEIYDDGTGIDIDNILEKAINKGIITSDELHNYTKDQAYSILFKAGFSTSKEVTDVSGRGVGLDVVKGKIESLGGLISIDSELGKGTTFTIQLPLTLSIISSMLVKVQDEKYAIPLSSIIETAVYSRNDIMHAQGQEVIDFRGKIVPIIYLKKVFNIPVTIEHDKDDIAIVIVKKKDKIAGIVVESFIGQQEIVLKSFGEYLKQVFAISGATILGDGQVALIIDTNALIK